MGGIKPELAGILVQPSEHRVDVLQRPRMRCLWREAIIDRIDRASQIRREQPILHILHLGCARHEAAAMDVHDGGQRVVGLDWAIGQNPDRLCAKRALHTDFVGGNIRQIRFGNGADDLEQVGAAARQRIGGQRLHWPQRERIAQFGVDKFYGAHDISSVRSRLGETIRLRVASRQPWARSVAVTANVPQRDTASLTMAAHCAELVTS